jgi:hypothetical protein
MTADEAARDEKFSDLVGQRFMMADGSLANG